MFMFHVKVLTDTIVPIADMRFSVLFSVSTVRSTPSPLAISGTAVPGVDVVLSPYDRFIPLLICNLMLTPSSI